MRKKFSPVGLVVAGLITTALIVAGLTAYYNTSTAYDRNSDGGTFANDFYVGID